MIKIARSVHKHWICTFDFSLSSPWTLCTLPWTYRMGFKQWRRLRCKIRFAGNSCARITSDMHLLCRKRNGHSGLVFSKLVWNLFNALKLKFQDANCAFSLFHSHCVAFFVAFHHSIENYTVCIAGFVVSLELFCLNKYLAFVLITNRCNFRCVISRNCY